MTISRVFSSSFYLLKEGLSYAFSDDMFVKSGLVTLLQKREERKNHGQTKRT